MRSEAPSLRKSASLSIDPDRIAEAKAPSVDIFRRGGSIPSSRPWRRHVMVTQFIAAVPESELRHRGGDLSAHRDEIIAALDLLFQGF